MVSQSGLYAVVETLHNDSDDEDKLFFFNLNNGNLLWERVQDAGNVNLFEFDESENVLFAGFYTI